MLAWPSFTDLVNGSSIHGLNFEPFEVGHLRRRVQVIICASSN